jgi:hypothetical protein
LSFRYVEFEILVKHACDWAVENRGLALRARLYSLKCIIYKNGRVIFPSKIIKVDRLPLTEPKERKKKKMQQQLSRNIREIASRDTEDDNILGKWEDF